MYEFPQGGALISPAMSEPPGADVAAGFVRDVEAISNTSNQRSETDAGGNARVLGC